MEWSEEILLKLIEAYRKECMDLQKLGDMSPYRSHYLCGLKNTSTFVLQLLVGLLHRTQ